MQGSGIEAFLTAEEEQEIIAAILRAERDTSGEIRVHIEGSAKKDPFQRAQEVFHFLKMDNTRESNGVLLYVAVQDRKFVIYGDKGIDRVVSPDFWETTKGVIESHFRTGEFKKGIIAGILKAGSELRAHFPWHPDDKNELSDEVSKG